MSSIEEVKARLLSAVEIAREAVGMMDGTRGKFTEAKGIVLDTIQGTFNEDAWGTMGAYDRILETLETTQLEMMRTCDEIETIVAGM